MIAAHPIVTERLRLDPLRVADAGEMHTVYGDDQMFEFTGGEPPTLEDLTRRYQALVAGRSPDDTESWLNWVVRPADEAHAIGVVQATGVNATRHAAIAWEIGVPWQGRGYAGEAATALVEWLRSRSVVGIEAHVHPDHAASQAVARRAGLEPTDETLDGEQVWRWAPS